jgi:hypothetical protein
MNNNCWYSLNIDFSNALRKDWVWEIPDLKKSSVQCVNTQMFNSDWLNYMKSIEVPIQYAMIFYRNSNFPNHPKTAHVDVKDVNGNKNPISYVPCAMNWLIEGQDSEMKWYNLPEEHQNVKYTMANTPYLDWPIYKLNEIDKINIQNSFTLVRTDIPHSVHVNEKPRWSISTRSSSFDTWDHAVNHFRSKNLLIER